MPQGLGDLQLPCVWRVDGIRRVKSANRLDDQDGRKAVRLYGRSSILTANDEGSWHQVIGV